MKSYQLHSLDRDCHHDALQQLLRSNNHHCLILKVEQKHKREELWSHHHLLMHLLMHHSWGAAKSWNIQKNELWWEWFWETLSNVISHMESNAICLTERHMHITVVTSGICTSLWWQMIRSQNKHFAIFLQHISILMSSKFAFHIESRVFVFLIWVCRWFQWNLSFVLHINCPEIKFYNHWWSNQLHWRLSFPSFYMCRF